MTRAARGSGRTARPLLVFTQTYDPDPAAVGQYMTDVCRRMAARGHWVIVYTADAGYDDPTCKYPRQELRDGVEVRRVPWVSVGKQHLLKRALGAAWFTLRCLVAGLFGPRPAGILVSTSPPLIGVVAVAVRALRGVPYAYWAMDINPDQLVALGKLTWGHPMARVLKAADERIVGSATLVVALDRFMAEKMTARSQLSGTLLTIPPWPRDPEVADSPRRDNPFRRKHGWGDDLVLLYSGNHTPSNPLSLFLDAARRLRDERGIRFAFIGGGVGKHEIDAAVRDEGLPNVTTLPYQSVDDLRWSLSAGDVHLASLGDPMVGVIHPSKVYSAMAAGRPILYVGPAPSHMTDLLEHYGFGWHIEHGELDALVDTIRTIAALPAERLREIGAAGRRAVDTDLDGGALSNAFCDALERSAALSS